MASDVIGRAVIEVAPDTTRFARQLGRDLNKAFRGFKKISVGVSVGSVRKAFVEVSKLNLALRAAVIGFTALGAKVIAGGILSTVASVGDLAGALGVLPGLAAAGGAGMATLKIGLFGVDDALKALVKGDLEKFNEALKELSPNAQQSLGALKDMVPRLKEFKNSVQDALFTGLGAPLRELGDKLLPRLELAFTQIARVFNRGARELAAFVTSAQTLRDVDRVLGNTTVFFDALRPAATGVAQIIRDVVAVSSEFLPQIAGLIRLVVERVRVFVAEMRQTGALEDFIGRGLVALTRLVNALFDIFQGIGGVMRAARTAGTNIIQLISNLAAGFDRFVNSVEGQAALVKFFNNAEKAADALFPVISALAKFFNDQFFPIVTEIATILSPSITEFIRALGRAFDAARPGVEAFARGVGQFIEGIAPALPAIGRLAGAIGTVLGSVLERIAPILEEVIVAIADALTEALQDPALVDGIVALVEAFGDFLVALTPLLPLLVRIAILILPVLARIIERLVPLIDPLIDIFEELLPFLDDFLRIAELLIIPLAGLATGFLRLVQISLLALRTIQNVFGQVLKAFFGPVVEGAKLAFQDAGRAIDDFAGRFDFLPEKVRTSMFSMLAGATGPLGALSGGFIITTRTVLDQLGLIDDGIGKFERSAHGNLVEKLPREVLGPAGSAITTFFGLVIRDVQGAERQFRVTVEEIKRIVTGMSEPLGRAGAAAGNSFASGIRSGVGSAVGAARDITGGVGSVLNGVDFTGAGAAAGNSFARGLTLGSVISRVKAAGAAVAAAAGSALPRSPAEIGPFSGRGWTPFRGRATAEGFAEGLTSGLSSVRDASLLLARVSALALTGDDVPRVASVPGATVAPPPTVNVTSNASPVNVKVLLDGRELRGVAVEVVDERDRALRRSVQSGAGGAR